MTRFIVQHLFKGLVTVAPLLLTVWLLYWATSGLEAFARTLLGARERRTSYDPSLGACAVCGCLQRVKVHLSMDVLSELRSTKELEYPDNCWLNEQETPDE